MTRTHPAVSAKPRIAVLSMTAMLLLPASCAGAPRRIPASAFAGLIPGRTRLEEASRLLGPASWIAMDAESGSIATHGPDEEDWSFRFDAGGILREFARVTHTWTIVGDGPAPFVREPRRVGATEVTALAPGRSTLEAVLRVLGPPTEGAVAGPCEYTMSWGPRTERWDLRFDQADLLVRLSGPVRVSTASGH